MNRARPAPAVPARRKPGYDALVERQSSKPRSRFTPCNLVTRAQARAILGAPVLAPVEAPQGPTCIYRTRAGDGFVTRRRAAGRRSSAIEPRLRQRRRIDVAGRAAYCGTYGQPMLYVPLARGRACSPSPDRCDVARRLRGEGRATVLGAAPRWWGVYQVSDSTALLRGHRRAAVAAPLRYRASTGPSSCSG